MYNSMKENLMEYLAKFAQNGKVVREEDIKQFFEVKMFSHQLGPYLFRVFGTWTKYL